MRLVRLVPERFRPLVPELLKFGAVGVVNTLLDFLIYNLLLDIGPLKAKVGSTIVATTASYVMNRHWTFGERDRSGVRREYVLFFGLNLVGLVIQLGVLGIAKYGMGFQENGTTVDTVALNVANALGIGIAMVFRFWAYRAFVFKAPETAETPETPETELHEPVHQPSAAPAQRRPAANEADEFDELTAPLEAELTAKELADLTTDFSAHKLATHEPDPTTTGPHH